VFQSHPRRGPRRHHRDPRRGPAPADVRFAFREVFGPGRWGSGRMRRGDVRPLILAALATRPMHGYEVIQELESRSGGRWRPSAGSVYPTLQQLADEGLVSSEDVEGRRVHTLTPAGRAAAAAAPAPAPWADAPSGGDTDLRQIGFQLIGAVMQVQRVGSPSARTETARILADARRQVYRLLADDEVEAPAAEPTPAADATRAAERPSAADASADADAGPDGTPA